jgi:hypothetical protein
VDDEDDDPEGPIPLGIKGAVRKVRSPQTGGKPNYKYFEASQGHSPSPQRRQQWYQFLSPTKIIAGVHMLILDVRTRWSSTHQMMSTCPAKSS